MLGRGITAHSIFVIFLHVLGDADCRRSLSLTRRWMKRQLKLTVQLNLNAGLRTLGPTAR